jgi:alpha-maltose-1-phosphate synthase
VRAAVLTREWPPDIYGGAGVHVEHLVGELRRRISVDVHCFGAPRPDATAHLPSPALETANPALRVLSTDLAMTAAVTGCDLVHSHTWYANVAGLLAGRSLGVPHVMTAHSLEPLRPWKAEQLGGGYAISCWAERAAIESADAVIAVSAGMRSDIAATYPTVDEARIHVVHNGIDVTVFHPTDQPDVLAGYGIDPDRPIVLYVGRITRQKGLSDLLTAADAITGDAQLVLCASAADTVELQREVETRVRELGASRGSVIWISEPVPRSDLVVLYSHATVFVCPSTYEPLGIVNLEAMACATAVVATKVGGIPEVVDDGVTGLLVASHDPTALARAINELVGDPDRATALGRAGRKRAEAEFSWAAVADRTLDVYAAVLAR